MNGMTRKSNIPEISVSMGCSRTRRKKAPDAIALVYAGEQISYSELNRRANQLSHYLIERGVGPEALVGICVERSLEMIVGLLGILKAGGAYLPLDPEYPLSRLRYIVRDSGVRVVIGGPLLNGQLGDSLVEVISLIRMEADAGDVTENPGPEVCGENLAYVIYTSGSTGTPKGAVIQHKAIVNRLEWMRRHYGIAPDDRILQKTPATFDVSVWELFLPLIAGATLVVAPPDSHKDPAWLASIVRKHRITTMHFIPSMLALFIASPLRRASCCAGSIAVARSCPRNCGIDLHGGACGTA